MNDIRVSTLSTEYIRVLVTAKLNGNFIDPTADDVEMAFVSDGNPEPDDFTPAEWEVASAEDRSYYARILIGPGSTVGILPVGSYAIWVRVVDSPETPVKKTTNRLVVY